MEHFTISGNIIYDLTDHLPNFLIINKFSTLSTNVKIYKRDFSKLNESAMINEVQSVDWNELLSQDTSQDTSNPTALFDLFYDALSSIVDKHIPIKQLSKRELNFQSKPWVTSGISQSIRVKNKLYKQYIKTKSPYYHSRFKFYRNKVNHLICISKRQYYNDYFIKNTKDTKLIWKGIKQIII